MTTTTQLPATTDYSYEGTRETDLLIAGLALTGHSAFAGR
jgi:hypothetical protein